MQESWGIAMMIAGGSVSVVYAILTQLAGEQKTDNPTSLLKQIRVHVIDAVTMIIGIALYITK